MSAMRGNYVAGKWVPSAGDGAVDVINPATEEVIDQVPAGHPADVDAAVEAARAAFGGWAATPVAERARYLEAIRQLLEDRAAPLAEVITADLGAPLAAPGTAGSWAQPGWKSTWRSSRCSSRRARRRLLRRVPCLPDWPRARIHRVRSRRI
jgi:hypothetical protein